MAEPSKNPKQRKSRYTADRGMAGAFEGETVTRRRVFEIGAQGVGGIAVAAFALPALGFALGPMFEDQIPEHYQDVGPEEDFNIETYVAKVIEIVPGAGEAGKTTIYVRTTDPARDEQNADQPYVAISTRCAHLGCPVRYVQALAPLHLPVPRRRLRLPGRGRRRPAGPPARPLLHEGRGAAACSSAPRFSLNSKLERFPHPRDPSNHLDGLWEYLYPARPST